MSGLIGGALPFPTLRGKELLLHPMARARPPARDRLGFRIIPANEGYYTGWWPGNRGLVGELNDIGVFQGNRGRPIERIAAGEASRVGFFGRTLDQFGTPLGGVTCSLFRTSTKEWIMDIISDINGNYLLQSWYSPDTHFVVFFKSGSPNVFGTTDQNLTGA